MEKWKRHSLTCWVFLRLLGITYLAAFVSFAIQANGLIGSNGILPVEQYLALVKAHAGEQSFWFAPSIFWFNSSDAVVQMLGWAGAAVALLIIADVLTLPALAVSWFLYLSIVTTGGDFMRFQWDTLLLETGFISIFLGTWNIRPKNPFNHEPSIAVLWLLRFLLFRLMFMSGLVKLASHDPTWRDYTAMSYHYLTQPLPVPLAWLLHKLPMQFHQFETVCVFVLELAVPFLIFAPRTARIAGAGLLIALQILIVLSGNYAFFNWLTMALCLTLLDDDVYRRILPRSFKEFFQGQAPSIKQRALPELLTAPAAVVLGLMAGGHFLTQAGLNQYVPIPVRQMLDQGEPFLLVNSYGLFAVMTTSRLEISVEGSNDGKTWLPYEFRFKPGALTNAPCLVAPHQPRLDWQMWFAALGSAEYNPWIIKFFERLLFGSPSVLALLEKNPFPDHPPKYIRAITYDYQFSNFEQLFKDGIWWTRKYRGEYFVPVSVFEDDNSYGLKVHDFSKELQTAPETK